MLGPGSALEFAHPIVRTAIYESIPPGERALAHARAASLFDQDGADAERVALTAARVLGIWGYHDGVIAICRDALAPGHDLGPAADELEAELFASSFISTATAGEARAAGTRPAGTRPAGRPGRIVASRRAFDAGIKVIGGAPGADPGTEIRSAARLELARLASGGKLRIVVAATYPLAEAAAAHRALATSHSHGKIVLVP